MRSWLAPLAADDVPKAEHPIVPIDVERARRDTPGCRRVIHFGNAGASLMPRPVLDAVRRHLSLEARIGGYPAAARTRDAQERVYEAAARLLNCGADEIALVESATRAWDHFFYAVPLHRGDRILTCVAEYGSNYIAFLQVARRTGAVIEVVPNDVHGQLCVESLRRMLDERVRLIAITHVPTNGGLVNPAAEVGLVARETGVLYLLDACQSVGQMPIDVQAIGCDGLAATGRKFLRGPRGTGVLYVRRGVLEQLEPPFLDLHAASWAAADRFEMRADARRFEAWEYSVAGRLGLGAAIAYALGWGLEAIESRVRLLSGSLREGLDAIPGVRTHDLGPDPCGIVTFSMEGFAPDAIQGRLARRGINVDVTTVGATRLEMEARGLSALVRAAPHYYNTEEEVSRVLNAVGTVAGGRERRVSRRAPRLLHRRSQ